jgi:hypothetical protein
MANVLEPGFGGISTYETMLLMAELDATSSGLMLSKTEDPATRLQESEELVVTQLAP